MLQISSLLLHDFQGHAQTTLQLGRLTFVHGGNGAGKSSLRRAIEWLLTAHVEDLAASGKAAATLLVRGYGSLEGAKRAEVVANLAPSGSLSRTVPNRLQAVHPTSGSLVTTEAELREAFHLPPPAAIALACNPPQLAELKADDLRALLFGLLTDGLAREEVLQAICDWLALQKGITPALTGAVLRWSQRQLPSFPTVADFDRLYQKAYDERREANGAVRALKQQVAGLTQTVSAVRPADPAALESARGALATYRTQSQALQQQLALAREANRRRNEAEQALAEAESRLAAVRAKTGVTAGDGDPGDEALLRAQIEALGQQIRSVRAQQGNCPVYGGVTCPLPQPVIEQQIAALSRQRQSLILELAQVVVWNARSQVQAARDACGAIPSIDVARTEAELAQVTRLEEQATERLQQLAANTGVQTSARAIRTNLLEQQQAAVAEAEVRQLLVKCFDSDGVRAWLLERRLQLLADRINAGLSHLMGPGWAVRLQHEGPHPILIRHPHHGAAVLKSLSTAERTVVSLAILDALNDFHQLGLLCLDDAEHLAGAYREAVYRTLQEWAESGRYGTILVLEAASGGDGLTVTVGV